MNTEAEAIQMARASIDSAVLKIDTTSHPNHVRAIVGDYHRAAREAIASGEQLRADRAELASKADLILPAGAARLEREARAEASHNAKTALNGARSQVEILRRAAMLETLPKVDKERELLGRSELDLVLGTGSPEQLLARVHDVAQSGSRDSVAALLSPFGASILKAKGLTGADLDGALQSARKVVVETAAEKDWHTESELRSARLYKTAGELDAGIASVSWALGHIGIERA